ncbi:hypothetical protein [Streptomyces venetus]|uniref:hypothetical protein n=1 Tax=Streptomyces venetus TaxID=1701086 RepID=UPI0031E654F3
MYTTWAKNRQRWAELHALYDGAAETARENPRLFGRLLAAGSVSETEAAVLSTNFADILAEQPAVTRAVISLTVEGYNDTDIADELNITHAAVPMRKTRFCKALYDAARERRIWIPEQLHTKADARRRTQRGAA